VGRSFTGHSHYLADLLGCESRGAPLRGLSESVCSIAWRNSLSEASSATPRRSSFSSHMPRHRREVSRFYPESLGDLLVVGTIRRSQDDAASAREPLGGGSSPRQVRERLALTLGEYDRRRLWARQSYTPRVLWLTVLFIDELSISGG